MEEKALLNNLMRSASVIMNDTSSFITTPNGSCDINYLYGGGFLLSQLKSHHNWYQSRLPYSNAMLGSYKSNSNPPVYSSLPQPPLLPLPFSTNNNAAFPLCIKKKATPSSKNNIKKKKTTKKPACFPKPTTKKVLVAENKEEEEEEEFFLSPPPSSLPLPRLLLTPRPKAGFCFAEADTGATNDLRRLLRL